MAFSKQIEAMPLIWTTSSSASTNSGRRKPFTSWRLRKKEQIFLFTCSQTTINLAGEVQKELAGETDTIHLFEIEQGTIRQSV